MALTSLNCNPWDTAKRIWKRGRGIFGIRENEDADTYPRVDTIMVSLLCLLIFFITAVIAIIHPSVLVKYIIVAINAVLALFIGSVLVADLCKRYKEEIHQPIRRSLLNTVLTILLTIVVLTAMYSQKWHFALNDVVIRQDTDTIHAPRYPAVAFFQGMNSIQANVQPGELKCSSGPRNDHDIQCSSLTLQQALRTQSCDCGDNWPSLERIYQGRNTITWLGKNTTYYAMVPGDTLVSKGSGHFLEMQIFFTYNSTDARLKASLTPSPGIWMAIYDASYNIEEMLADGQMYTAQVDANSHTVVNIGLRYYTYQNKTAHYKYDVSISTRQNIDLVCDVVDEVWWPCHLTVEIQIPSFVRTIIAEEKRIDWSRVIADAGAYFALIQFLSWIASGMAWY